QEAKMFNIRAAIGQPGIIDTRMSRRVASETGASPYLQARRMARMFASSLQKPTPPVIVGQEILEIIESGMEKLRNPVGPDAEGFLQWRASMTDEQWVDWGLPKTKRGIATSKAASASTPVHTPSPINHES